MRSQKLVILLLVFSCSHALLGQAQPSDSASDKEKKQKDLEELVVKILDQTIADIPALRLAQNRAVISAMCADLYWKFDEKRAHELFRSSANELIAANADSEREAAATALDQGINIDDLTAMMDQSDQRADILRLVARHDGDLALEMLYQTRPPKLAEAMAKAAATGADAKTGLDILGSVMGQAKIQQENALEQQLQLLAAGEDPDKAAKMLHDSLAKGVNAGMINQLQKIYDKDPKKVPDLAAEVLRRSGDSNLAGSQEDLRAALSFLQYGVRPAPAPGPDGKSKTFAFPDAGLKDLANKLLNALLLPSRSMVMQMTVTQAIPVLEKYVPERIALFKQKDAENKKALPSEMKSAMDLSRLYDPNVTAEEVLAQIARTPSDNDKKQLYGILTSKISQVTDDARAKKLIDQIPDDKTRAAAQAQFDAGKITRAIGAGNIDEARRLIGTLTNRQTRLQRLVVLAVAVQKKGTDKDAELAQSLMKEARALANDYPEDEDDIADIMTLVSGYTSVDPDTAFRIAEPLINEFNDLVQASAVVSKYNKRDRTFKNGELMMRVNGTPGGLLPFRYVGQIQGLGKADLDRSSALADRFSRNDVRSLVKLYVVQGFLREDPKPKAAVPSPVKTPTP
ncbi:MAG: hypothetical protein JO053_13850 [Acidobacteria bacterium]|nr:hypothetical protein [Acidobacteriota bacterium]